MSFKSDLDYGSKKLKKIKPSKAKSSYSKGLASMETKKVKIL